MLDFRAAHLPNKYWGRGSVLVPARPVKLDERFKPLNDLYLDHDKREAFDIYWIEQGVAGNVTLPGELNYAYINGKYYHLEKVSNQGMINNGGHVETEWGYYLEYDDWQNEWLTNGIHLEGTISKTGDYKLASSHIIQLSPLITGCSNYKFYLSGAEYKKDRRVIQDGPYTKRNYIYTPQDIKEFNGALNQIISKTMETTERTRLRIPLILAPRNVTDASDLILHNVVKFLKRPDLKVFDVKKDVLNFASFKTKNKINQVYCITTKEYHTFEVAETENQHARIKDEIVIPRGIEIEYLNSNLTVMDERAKEITLDDLVEKYLKRYPNITTTRDKGEFKYIAFEEIYTTFASLLTSDEDKRSNFGFYKWGGVTKNINMAELNKPLKNNDLCGAHPFPNERLRAINGIYQPGTPPYKIFNVLVNAEYPKNCSQTIEINKKFPPKTFLNWWSTNNPNELESWLKWLSSKSYIELTHLQIKDNPTGVLKGNLLLNHWAYFNYYDDPDNLNAHFIYLLPDYRSMGWVLGVGNVLGRLYENDYHDWINEDDRKAAFIYTLIREIGLVDANKQGTWLHPLTDTILNNNNKRWSKYAFIIPLMVRWLKGYNWALDSYEYKFYYEFTQQRWKRVKEAGSNTFESKRFSLVFHFPLSGCGFDIYELLKDYRNISDKYLRWNFICSEEYKTKQNWMDKGGEFEQFFDIGASSNNEPISREDQTKNTHTLHNEGIEIRIYPHAGNSRDRILQLIFKLWVYYFGWRWDGSYNGAVLFTNHGSQNESGFLKIMWAKPFNRRWYMCGIWLNNYYGNSLQLNRERQANGELLYGKGSPTWNPRKEVWAIGYQYAHNLTGTNIDDVKDVLTSNVNEIELKINTDGDYEKIDTFESTNLDPVKFSHLLYGDKPWENIKFKLGIPDQTPFANFELGKRLRDIVRESTYTTNRTINPTSFNPWIYKPIDEISLYTDDQEISQNWANKDSSDAFHPSWNVNDLDTFKNRNRPLTYLIPFFLYSVIDPDNVSSKFKHLNFTGSAEDSKKNFRSVLQQEMHNALTTLNTRPFIFDIKGSEFIGIGKININGDMELELISKSNASIESVEAKEYTFNNPTKSADIFEEFVKRLNSQFEISIFGQRIPIKTRPDTTRERIDIGLKITPINDPKQSNTSLWYMVEIKTTQDTQRTRIEVPKELNAMNIQNAYEREHMIRTLAYHNRDRQLENLQQKDEISRYSFDIDIKGRRMDINRNKEVTGEIIGMAQTAIQASQAMGLSGWFGGGAAVAAAGMASGIAGQMANMVYSKQLYNLDKQEHLYHAALGESALMRRAEGTRNKHELAEQADKLKLYNMQANINYPANSDALMFREENKQMNLTDIHLTQYYPDGDLLNFLIDYYKEYGFNVIVPNQRCFGIDWITGHIQFVKITNNVHPNETIRRMIEERALLGVTLNYNEDWHADKLHDLTGDYTNRGD